MRRKKTKVNVLDAAVNEPKPQQKSKRRKRRSTRARAGSPVRDGGGGNTDDDETASEIMQTIAEGPRRPAQSKLESPLPPVDPAMLDEEDDPPPAFDQAMFEEAVNEGNTKDAAPAAEAPAAAQRPPVDVR